MIEKTSGVNKSRLQLYPKVLSFWEDAKQPAVTALRRPGEQKLYLVDVLVFNVWQIYTHGCQLRQTNRYSKLSEHFCWWLVTAGQSPLTTRCHLLQPHHSTHDTQSDDKSLLVFHFSSFHWLHRHQCETAAIIGVQHHLHQESVNGSDNTQTCHMWTSFSGHQCFQLMSSHHCSCTYMYIYTIKIVRIMHEYAQKAWQWIRAPKPRAESTGGTIVAEEASAKQQIVSVQTRHAYLRGLYKRRALWCHLLLWIWCKQCSCCSRMGLRLLMLIHILLVVAIFFTQVSEYFLIHQSDSWPEIYPNSTSLSSLLPLSSKTYTSNFIHKTKESISTFNFQAQIIRTHDMMYK